jgi:predicted metal-dependent hydrolase
MKASGMSIRISNLVAITKDIHVRANALVIPLVKSNASIPESSLDDLLDTAQDAVVKVNLLCLKKGGAPEDLPTPSFHAYQWLKFLSQRKWLLSHLYALAEFYHLLLDLFPALNQKNLSSNIQIDLSHSSYLFRSRKLGKKVYLEINEGFINCPKQIKETILLAALQRRTQSRLKAIRTYAASSEYAKIHSALQVNNGDNQLAGRGKVYDLSEMFRRINQQYFKNELAQPRLVWSARSSSRRLGTYQPDADTISLSRRLDSRDIPQILVEYVLYHEMLHKKLGLKEVNGRRYAHTSTFRKLEKQFEGYVEAEKIMRAMHKT